MVRVIIESDNPIAVNVTKQESGIAKLLKDIKEGVIDESHDETFTANSPATN